MALNSEIATPIASTRAKPMMIVAPNCWPKKYSTAHVIKVDVFESRIEGQARSSPARIAAAMVLPLRSSSFMRSKIRMLASTAMPTDRMNPAMPANVNVTGISLNIDRVTSE